MSVLFTKHAHKSSKGGAEYLEGVQRHAADGAAAMGEGEVTALISPPWLLRTSVLLNGWPWLCAFTIYEGLSHGTRYEFYGGNCKAIFNECRMSALL